MDHLQKFISQIRFRLLGILLLNNALIVLDWWIVEHFLQLKGMEFIVAVAGLSFLTITVLPWISANYIVQPTKLIWQAILHIAPDTGDVKAPDLKHLRLGHELVTALIGRIYQLASVADNIEKIAKNKKPDLRAEFIGTNLPMPVAVLDKDLNVVFVNEAFSRYTGKAIEDAAGQNMYLVLDMLFSTNRTFDSWLEKARENKVTSTSTWERVRLNLPDQKETKLFDLVAYYNKSNPDGFELILTLFDRTRQYSQDEQAMSFLALAVHELRTPLTLLRGYIDVFEEELSGKLDPELSGYLTKMKATAQQLTGFVGNVLNVSRFENDQLVLKLREEQWAPLLQSAVNDMALRAKVRGISLKIKVDDKLPTVGADAASIYEVINNLVDNAIKYSKENSEIVIKSYLTTSGLVETTVQDFGVGIPESAVGNLFDKFYRDYRNRTQVGGTGMGLYLSKTIISAHGGNIWVRSKEGGGSTFGFTLVPYAKLEDEKKNEQSGIVRTAHGWIKNHSMYRR
ncbi:MAG TPA: ATP-binding protein [Candidatus Saccharimonadales bacterium]